MPDSLDSGVATNGGPADAEPVVPAWGHVLSGLHVGLLRPASETDPPGDARALIAETFARYCWGYDERRLDLLADLYTVDATYTLSIRGQREMGQWHGRDEIVAHQASAMERQNDQRRHHISTILVDELAGDRATAFAYLMLTGTKGDSVRLITTGWYRGDLTIDEGKWRFARIYHGLDGGWT
jgi:SnoaL-like domain